MHDAGRGGDVSREAFDRLTTLAQLVEAENERQNLVGRMSIEDFWSRHIVDSIQLHDLSKPADQDVWVDIGTGGGFPGLAIACVHPGPVICAEPRKLRSAFLKQAAKAIGLPNVTIFDGKAQHLSARADVISARAVAPPERLLAMTAHLGHDHTRWVMPAGASASEKLETLRLKWQGDFGIVPSVTDPRAGIILASNVKRILP